MEAIKKIFGCITAYGAITIIQSGFLYEDRVDTRKRQLVFQDFITLVRHLLKNKSLNICFEIKGKENVESILEVMRAIGVTVTVLRNEHSCFGIDTYEVDALLTIDLCEEAILQLSERFYQIVDAALIYPVGYMAWGDYLKNKNK